MADVVSPETRSKMMSGIRGANTKPEILVRKALHQRGFRFRLHDSRLPGRPDIVLPRHQVAIFVHGCFWHGHDCHLFKWPSTRPDFWRTKIARNRIIDERSLAGLAKLGWRVGVVWECSIKGKHRIGSEEAARRLVLWLLSGRDKIEIRGG